MFEETLIYSQAQSCSILLFPHSPPSINSHIFTQNIEESQQNFPERNSKAYLKPQEKQNQNPVKNSNFNDKNQIIGQSYISDMYWNKFHRLYKGQFNY